MKLIVGLGNPDQKFINTRHNIGFKIIDYLCENLNIQLNNKKFNGLFYKNDLFIIAKPLTYMNLSGDFVLKIANYFQIKPEDICIIYDDKNIDFGNAKVKTNSSGGSHNGIKDIIDKLQTKSIWQLKIGIGSNYKNLKNFVLRAFTVEEQNKILENKTKIIQGLLLFLENKINQFIQLINSKNV